MSPLADGQPFAKPWVVPDEFEDLFSQTAAGFGFKTEQFAKPGEIISIASAEAEIPDDNHGIRVSGDNWSNETWWKFEEAFHTTVLERKGGTTIQAKVRG